MRRRRVVVTGLGAIASNGIGKDEFFRAVVEGKSGIDYIQSFDTQELPVKVAGEVVGFELSDYCDTSDMRRAGKLTHFAMASASLAVQDANIDLTRERSSRVGTCFGTSSVTAAFHEQMPRFSTNGFRGIKASHYSEFSPHSITAQVCITMGIRGVNTTLSSGCTSGLEAVGWGLDKIGGGEMDTALVGSVDSHLNQFEMAGLCKLKILSRNSDEPQRASRPYDRDGDGMVVSEGGGAVVLEELEHARDRGATIYGEVLGYKTTSEAKDMFRVDVQGADIARTIEQALAEARVLKDEVDYIHAHGNAIPTYDIAETRAFKSVFGSRAYRIPVSSIKSTIGHAYAAASIQQFISTCLTLQTGLIPPTTNLDHPAPGCDLDYVPHQARKNPVEIALMNSQGEGRTHGVLVVRRYTEARRDLRSWANHTHLMRGR